MRSEGKRLGLFSHYRPLKVQEKRLLITAIILASAVLLFSLGFLFVYLGAFGGFIWIYIPLALMGLVLICIFASKAQLYWRMITICGEVFPICCEILLIWTIQKLKVLSFGTVSWSMRPSLAMQIVSAVSWLCVRFACKIHLWTAMFRLTCTMPSIAVCTVSQTTAM